MDGEAEAGGAGAVGAWVKQFDPNHGRHYYWNSETDEVSWDEPADFVEGTTDARVDAITKIQAVFRGGAVRSRCMLRYIFASVSVPHHVLTTSLAPCWPSITGTKLSTRAAECSTTTGALFLERYASCPRGACMALFVDVHVCVCVCVRA